MSGGLFNEAYSEDEGSSSRIEGMSGFKKNVLPEDCVPRHPSSKFFAKILNSIITPLKEITINRCDRSSSCNIKKFNRFMKGNFTFGEE